MLCFPRDRKTSLGPLSGRVKPQGKIHSVTRSSFQLATLPSLVLDSGMLGRFLLKTRVVWLLSPRSGGCARFLSCRTLLQLIPELTVCGGPVNVLARGLGLTAIYRAYARVIAEFAP